MRWDANLLVPEKFSRNILLSSVRKLLPLQIMSQTYERSEKVNFLQNTRNHLSRIHPEVQEANETKSAQQLRLSSTGQAVTTEFQKRERFAKALSNTSLPYHISVSRGC